ESSQCADSSSRHEVESFSRAHIFRARAQYLDVVEPELCDLFVEPVDASFHRLDKRPADVCTSDREYQPRQSRTGADVRCGAVEDRRGYCAVENVARPEAREFEGADQSPLFALCRKCRRELTGEVDPVTEYR